MRQHLNRAGDDTLNGGDNDDLLNGGDGNDVLYGHSGNDTFIASAGLDTINEYSGTDTIQYGPGVDLEDLTLTDTGSTDVTIVLNSGTDEIEVLTQRDGNPDHHVDKILFDSGFSVNFADYANWLSATDGDASANTIIGSASADDLDGNGGDDELHGMAGNDILHGNDGADQIHGGTGDDTLYGGAGADLLWGGDGTDTVDYSEDGAAVTVDLATGTATDGSSSTDTISQIENVTGSNYNDTLTGDSGNNVLTGGLGDDTLKGGTGNDTLNGGSGTSDTVDYSGAALSGVTVNLNAESASNDGDGGTDTLTGIENVIGSDFGDTITGSIVQNNLDGRGGDDTISGSWAADIISGGEGNDTLYGNLGSDTIDGGYGTDTVSYSLSATGVIINLNTGSASGEGSDNLSNIENATGSALYADAITGSNLANVLNGGGGNDIISGLDGWDTIDGGTGEDTLYGGAGIDTLLGMGDNDIIFGGADADLIGGGAGSDEIDGGAGADILYGGTDADTFFFFALTAYDGIDTIGDFTAGVGGDAINFEDLLSGYDPQTEAIADFLSATENAGNTILSVDRDGTGGTYSAEDVVQITGVTGLTVQDLIDDGNLIVPV